MQFKIDFESAQRPFRHVLADLLELAREYSVPIDGISALDAAFTKSHRLNAAQMQAYDTIIDAFKADGWTVTQGAPNSNHVKLTKPDEKAEPAKTVTVPVYKECPMPPRPRLAIKAGQGNGGCFVVSLVNVDTGRHVVSLGYFDPHTLAFVRHRIDREALAEKYANVPDLHFFAGDAHVVRVDTSDAPLQTPLN